VLRAAQRALATYRALDPHGAILSFVGLLVFATGRFATEVHWGLGSGALAGRRLHRVTPFGVEVLWVVLGSGALAAFLAVDSRRHVPMDGSGQERGL
jgi:hypothetical protein